MNLIDVTLGSPRLLQRTIGHRYAQDIFREFTPQVTRYMYPSPPRDISDTVAFIEASLRGLVTGTNLQLVILDGTSGDFLGCSGLHGIGGRTPELGIWLKEGAQGKGYGLEAVSAIVAWARARLDFDHLIYPVERDNARSRAIPEALGGRVEEERVEATEAGRPQDLVVYWIDRHGA